MVALPAHPIVDQETKFGRRIALVSITLGMTLSLAKIWVGMAGGSASVTSDGFETASDVFSSAIVYAGLWLASKPPDDEHPYGHGRYETLAGLGVGAILLLTGAGIFTNSLLRISEGSKVQLWTLYPLFAAILLKSALASTKFHVGRKIDSTALQADAWHDITDLLSTAVALVSTGLVLIDPARFGVADRIGGMLIGIIIFFLSIQVVRRVVDQLLDTMPEPAKMAEIRAAALGVPGALAIEKCFARRTGLKYHVDLHLEVNPEMTVRESHDIAAAVKHAIRDNLPWVADVLVHVEPGTAPLSNYPSHGKQRHRSTAF
jgi:cation diffusion facilitator family transporter